MTPDQLLTLVTERKLLCRNGRGVRITKSDMSFKTFVDIQHLQPPWSYRVPEKYR